MGYPSYSQYNREQKSSQGLSAASRFKFGSQTKVSFPSPITKNEMIIRSHGPNLICTCIGCCAFKKKVNRVLRLNSHENVHTAFEWSYDVCEHFCTVRLVDVKIADTVPVLLLDKLT